MKDRSHHRKKTNRRVIRSAQKDEAQALSLPDVPPRKQTAKQVKKQAKKKIAQVKKARAPLLPDLEERNKKIKKRTPVFDRSIESRPKGTKKTKKKTPHL